MDVKSTALATAGLVAFGIFAADVGARSQVASSHVAVTREAWAIDSGGPNAVWKLNTQTGALYYCVPTEAFTKVQCTN
jgi:hypothetical protein